MNRRGYGLSARSTVTATPSPPSRCCDTHEWEETIRLRRALCLVFDSALHNETKQTNVFKWQLLKKWCTVGEHSTLPSRGAAGPERDHAARPAQIERVNMLSGAARTLNV